MKLAPIVIAAMLAAFFMPTMAQKLLGTAENTAKSKQVSSSAASKLRKLKRPTGEEIATLSEDYEEDEYTQPGQAIARRDSRGHFSFDAVMNGADVKVLVDTGASSVAINASTAEAMGIEYDEDSPNVTVNTANGQTPGYQVTIDEIVIDDIVVSNVDALVLDDDSLSTTLLGMSFLGKLERFEISGNTLTLTR